MGRLAAQIGRGRTSVSHRAGGLLSIRLMEVNDSEVAHAPAYAVAHSPRQVRQSPAPFEKSLTDFATTADIKAEEAILEVLRAALVSCR
jgi:hypothetical protein